MRPPWLQQGRPANPRLGSRLTRAALGAAALALLVAALIPNILLYRTQRADQVAHALAQARITADSIAAAWASGDRKAGVEALAFLRASEPVVAALARDSGSAVFASFSRDYSGPVIAWPDSSGEGVLFDGGHLHLRVPVLHGDRQLGHLELTVSLQAPQRQQTQFALVSIAAALAALAMAYLLITGARRVIDRAEARQDELAYIDAVTGLFNHRAAQEQLKLLIERHSVNGRRFGVVLLDLEDFSTINDSLGHATGDEVLKTVADRLKLALVAGETAFRFGGDRFVVVFDADELGDGARHAAAVAQIALAASVQVGGFEMQIRGSAGIAEFPRDAYTEDQLMRAADAAMYSAKHGGKNACVSYDEQLTQTSLARSRIESELGQAMARDELTLLYQPIIDMDSGEIVGAEALLRWQHPQRGLIGPAAFLDIAEQSNLIVDIGQRVLDLATRQIVAWESQGIADIYIAVNTSARQLRGGALLDQVARALAQSRANPARLEIEITERSLVDAQHAVVQPLVSLRGLGVRIAIDNFGTGLSSLAYLRRLPIDKLKIDRSFVRELPGNPSDAAIVTAVASMGRALGLRVVAEGIETVAQRRFLEDLRIHFGQGYLFGRPMPAADLARLLRRVRPLSAVAVEVSI